MINKIVKRRLEEFETLGSSGVVVFDFQPFLNLKVRATVWSELAFCISTANSSAISGLHFQKQLEEFDLQKCDVKKIEEILKRSGVRFYARKAIYITNALSRFDDIIKVLHLDDVRARERLVKTVKGLGYKEASHFLRNVGRKNVAIVDRHIVRWLYEKGFIDKIPTSLSKKMYLKIERILKELSRKRGVSLAELDLVLWYEKTKKVLK